MYIHPFILHCFQHNHLMAEILYLCLQIFILFFLMVEYRDASIGYPPSPSSALVFLFMRICFFDFGLGFFVNYFSYKDGLVQGFLAIEFIMFASYLSFY